MPGTLVDRQGDTNTDRQQQTPAEGEVLASVLFFVLVSVLRCVRLVCDVALYILHVLEFWF